MNWKNVTLRGLREMMLKRRIAADLIEFFGAEVIRRLLDGVRPGWESDLRMSRERHLSVVMQSADPSRNQPRQ
jgi:hypothetical protein